MCCYIDTRNDNKSQKKFIMLQKCTVKEAFTMNEEDSKQKQNDLQFSNSKEALFALQMYMNRFMWISTKEIVTGIDSTYYNDIKDEKKHAIKKG